VIKAISTASGSSSSAIENEWKRKGDLGLVAESLLTKKKQATLFSNELTVKRCFEKP